MEHIRWKKNGKRGGGGGKVVDKAEKTGFLIVKHGIQDIRVHRTS